MYFPVPGTLKEMMSHDERNVSAAGLMEILDAIGTSSPYEIFDGLGMDYHDYEFLSTKTALFEFLRTGLYSEQCIHCLEACQGALPIDSSTMKNVGCSLVATSIYAYLYLSKVDPIGSEMVISHSILILDESIENRGILSSHIKTVRDIIVRDNIGKYQYREDYESFVIDIALLDPRAKTVCDHVLHETISSILTRCELVWSDNVPLFSQYAKSYGRHSIYGRKNKDDLRSRLIHILASICPCAQTTREVRSLIEIVSIMD